MPRRLDSHKSVGLAAVAGWIIRQAHATFQPKDRDFRGKQQEKRRQEEDKTRPQSPATELRGAASQCGQARPEDKRRTRPGHRVQGGLVSAARGQQQDKRTRPGHTVQGRGQTVWPGLVSAARWPALFQDRTPTVNCLVKKELLNVPLQECELMLGINVGFSGSAA